MLALAELESTAREAASDALGTGLQDVRTETSVGSDGGELLRITLVIDAHVLESLEEQRFLQALLAIKRRLREAGDDHRIIIGYATPEELADNGDPES